MLFESPFIAAHRKEIVDLAATHQIAVIYDYRRWAELGGLMSYGPSYFDLSRRAAVFGDKILKGAKPGDLPIEQPMRFDLAINMKTSKTLGLTIPQALLGRADELIQ